MNKPKMILFDYGETLIAETRFDGVRGTKAVLAECVANPHNITAEEVQQLANELNVEIGRFDPETSHLCVTEVHNHPFNNYLYDYFGLKRTVTSIELETVFWDAASPGKPTHNIDALLDFLARNNIRASVVSNISFSGQALENRINTLLPNNHFEFIIASSEYVFRKPHRRIFDIAAKKARLEPQDIWYCGDNAICDVDGAKMAGLTPVWYKGAHGYGNSPSFIPQEECLIIQDWLELIDMLKGITLEIS
jgi:putative hydrolase of the HAD superfamily